MFGRLILKALNDSYTILTSQVPFEITSRHLAAYIQIAGKDCNYYVSQAVTDAPKVATICAAYPFTSLDKIKAMLRPLYFNDATARQALMDSTKMTDAEVTLLYNGAITTSFGGAA